MIEPRRDRWAAEVTFAGAPSTRSWHPRRWWFQAWKTARTLRAFYRVWPGGWSTKVRVIRWHG